jgi:hypothetical protein
VRKTETRKWLEPCMSFSNSAGLSSNVWSRDYGIPRVDSSSTCLWQLASMIAWGSAALAAEPLKMPIIFLYTAPYSNTSGTSIRGYSFRKSNAPSPTPPYLTLHSLTSVVWQLTFSEMTPRGPLRPPASIWDFCPPSYQTLPLTNPSQACPIVSQRVSRTRVTPMPSDWPPGFGVLSSGIISRSLRSPLPDDHPAGRLFYNTQT